MKTCLITGGNSGIGYASALQLSKKGFEVIIVSRNKDKAIAACKKIKEEAENDNIKYIIADLSIISDIKNVVKVFALNHERLDVLINNAADFDITVKKPVYTKDNLEKQFATNVIAPFILTELLIPFLKKAGDGKVINISSKGLVVYPFIRLDFDNLNSEKKYSASKTYYQNKLALLMNSLYQKEKYPDIDFLAVRVTAVKVDISRFANMSKFNQTIYKMKSKFSITPEEMAEVYVALATDDSYKGFLYDENLKEVKANKSAYDKVNQKKLYDICSVYLN